MASDFIRSRASALFAEYDAALKNGTLTDELAERITDDTDQLMLQKKIHDLGENVGRTRAGLAGPLEGKTGADLLGARFERAELETFHKAVTRGASYSVKAVQEEANLGPSSGTVITLGVSSTERDRFRVASLIPAENAGDGGSSVTIYRNTAAASGATAVAESGSKPQSSPTWAPVEEPIRKLAHYAYLPTEAVQDWSGFANVLSTELREGLINVENAAILSGNGTPPNLAGITDRAIQTNTQAGDTLIDSILRAASDVRSVAFMEPDAIIVTPATYFALRIEKDGTDAYAFGNPANTGERNLDGIPIYVSSAMTANHVLVGNFASARIYVRQAPVVQTSESDADDFVENKIKFRAEERFALAVPHLNAFVDLTLAS